MLNYATAERTLDFVDHLRSLKLAFPHSFLVVDNFSSVAQRELLRTKLDSSDTILICIDENRGYAHGNNVGLRAIAVSDPNAIVFVCNNDICFSSSDLITVLYERLAAGLDDFVGARMATDQGVVPQLYKSSTLLEDILSFSPIFRRRSAKAQPQVGLEETESLWVRSEVLNGSFFAGLIENFIRAEYFDERTFLYCEERIFGERCKRQGMRLSVYQGDSYHHAEGATIRSVFPVYSRLRILCESRIIFYRYYRRGLASIVGQVFHRMLEKGIAILDRYS